MWKNHTQPRQPGTSSSWWSHTAVGWHPILQPAFVAGQSTWLCWSLPQVFNGVEVRTGRPFHPLHSQILCELSSWRTEFGPRLWTYGIATGCRISSRYLSALRWPHLFSDGDAAPHHHTASTKEGREYLTNFTWAQPRYLQMWHHSKGTLTGFPRFIPIIY